MRARRAGESRAILRAEIPSVPSSPDPCRAGPDLPPSRKASADRRSLGVGGWTRWNPLRTGVLMRQWRLLCGLGLASAAVLAVMTAWSVTFAQTRAADPCAGSRDLHLVNGRIVTMDASNSV